MDKRDRIEEVLRGVGPEGAIVAAIADVVESSDTAVRRYLKVFEAEGKVSKRPGQNGNVYTWVLDPEPVMVPDELTSPASADRALTPRRVAANERNLAALDVLEGAGELGLPLPVIAQKIGAPDIEPAKNGYSAKTYLALRRLADEGKVEKIQHWRLIPN